MRVRIEPKEFFMYAVFLAFEEESPDPEDEAVKVYLEEHELIPKSQGTHTLDGQDFDVMHFGGCYLGRHLQVIDDMQRKAVEQEILADEIERRLNESWDIEARLFLEDVTETLFKELVGDLAQEFNRESSFGRDEEGYLKATLESALIVERFKELVGSRS